MRRAGVSFEDWPRLACQQKENPNLPFFLMGLHPTLERGKLLPWSARALFNMISPFFFSPLSLHLILFKIDVLTPTPVAQYE